MVKITWLVDARWQQLVADNPVIDRTVVFPRQGFRGMFGKIRSVPWALRLRRIRPEVALDLQGLLRSALMARLSHARRVVGMSDAREGAGWFYHEAAPVDEDEHAVRRYLRTLERFGIPKIDKPVFPLPPGAPVSTRLPNQRWIVIHPFARGEGKSLTPEQVVEFCHSARPLTVVVAGVGALRQALPDNAVNLLNQTTIQQMIWLLRARRNSSSAWIAAQCTLLRLSPPECSPSILGAIPVWWVRSMTKPGSGKAVKFAARSWTRPHCLPHGRQGSATSRKSRNLSDGSSTNSASGSARINASRLPHRELRQLPASAPATPRPSIALPSIR